MIQFNFFNGLDGLAEGFRARGSSSIKGMLCLRGQAADYDHWRQLGNEGWGWDDVLPIFKRSKDYYGGADAMHGSGGEWRLEAPRVDWELLDAFCDAAEAVGIPKADDFNRGTAATTTVARISRSTSGRDGVKALRPRSSARLPAGRICACRFTR
jgi:choline dehydrogenase-like flavoprotein